MTEQRRASALLLLGLLAALFAVFVALTGGIDTRIGGVVVRSRSWERPATVAIVLLAAWLFFVRHRLAGVPARLFRLLPVLIVLWGGIASLVFGTYAAGGADSFGYISQAELIAHGRLAEPMPSNPRRSSPVRCPAAGRRSPVRSCDS